MKTKKTRQELEEEYSFSQSELLCAGIVALVLFISFCYVSIKLDMVETQLSECQEQVPGLSNLHIKNNSKGEYSIGVWSKNGALVPSENPLIQKLNDLISYSHSEEWKYYIYTFEEKYYINSVEINNLNIRKENCYRELKPICNPYPIQCEINKNQTGFPRWFYPMMCWDTNCSGDFEIIENCEVIE